MSDTNNISAAKPAVGGAISMAPFGTQVPTDATTALNSAFKNLGYISDDGMKNNSSIDSEEKKAWGGDSVYAAETGKTDTFTCKFIETLNVDVLKAVYGSSNVSGTLANGISINVNSKEHEYCAWICDMILKGDVLKRIVIPRGKITNVAEITYKDNDLIGYEVTISAAPYNSNGDTHHEYLKGKATSQSS